MKKIFSLVMGMVFAFSVASAQDSFNGTIVYNFNIEGEGVEQFQSMMPKTMTMSYLKSDMMMEMDGGMMAMMMGKILVHGKKGKAYIIKDAEETIYVVNDDEEEEDESDEEEAKPDVQKTDETKEIAGYTCTKYAIVQETPMGEVTSYIWATEQLKPVKPAGGMSGMGMGSMSIEGLPGLPLRMETVQGPMTVILEAASVDANAPSKKMFKLPKGYDKEDFDPSMMMGGGGVGY